MLIATLFYVALAKQIKNGIVLDKHVPQSGVQPLLDGGLYPFNFGKGNLGEEVDRFFIINAPDFQSPDLAPAVALIDCYCGGDTFSLLDNGLNVGVTQSSPINATPLCTYNEDTPKDCIASIGDGKGIYYSVAAFLSPGFHNITIKTGASPFGAGTAFLYYYTAAIDSPFTFTPVCFLEGNFSFENCYLDVASF